MDACTGKALRHVGPTIIFYDEPEKFMRAYGICAKASNAMNTTLSVSDGASAMRLLVDQQYSAYAPDPHIIVHMSMQPHKFMEVMECMVDNGSASRFLITEGIMS